MPRRLPLGACAAGAWSDRIFSRRLAKLPGSWPGSSLKLPKTVPYAQADLSVNTTLRVPRRKLRSTSQVNEAPSSGPSCTSVCATAWMPKHTKSASAESSDRIGDRVVFLDGVETAALTCRCTCSLNSKARHSWSLSLVAGTQHHASDCPSWDARCQNDLAAKDTTKRIGDNRCRAACTWRELTSAPSSLLPRPPQKHTEGRFPGALSHPQESSSSSCLFSGLQVRF